LACPTRDVWSARGVFTAPQHPDERVPGAAMAFVGGEFHEGVVLVLGGDVYERFAD
jgi:hypothetical protein